jgi:hypothetical protein
LCMYIYICVCFSESRHEFVSQITMRCRCIFSLYNLICILWNFNSLGWYCLFKSCKKNLFEESRHTVAYIISNYWRWPCNDWKSSSEMSILIENWLINWIWKGAKFIRQWRQQSQQPENLVFQIVHDFIITYYWWIPIVFMIGLNYMYDEKA